MWQKIVKGVKDFWGSLPHQVQAAIIAFGTAAGTVLGEEIQALASGQASFTAATIKHDLLSAGAAGLLALRAFYMFPNRPPQPPDPPTPTPPGGK
jgi:hypothetical protein